jgi:hypothetical protein
MPTRTSIAAAMCHNPPITVNGTLIVGCDDGFVYGFNGTELDP